MRNVTEVNVAYLKQAVEEMNGSDLFPLKIQLGPELKEATLKIFMDSVEAVPVEKEGEIPAKVVEIYNFIFDDEYQIPEGIFEEAEMEEEVVAPASATGEAPVKEKKVKEPKEKVVKEKKPSALAERRIFLHDMIVEGIHTRKQIAEACVAKFGGNITTILTILSDSKNSKYNKFEKLVVENNKIYSFGD
jgi:hypothetical protein